MTKKSPSTRATETFVRRVLAKSFNQKIDAETLRIVAKKVAVAVETRVPSRLP